jgi:hypothetical protein
MGLQRRQGAFQGLDRAGPLGGQVLRSLAAGTLKLQGVLELSNPVMHRLVGGSAARGLVIPIMAGCSSPAWVQAGCEQILGWDPPYPTLTGDGA